MRKITSFVLTIVLIGSFFVFNVTAITEEATPTVIEFSLTADIEQTLDIQTTDMRATGLILSYGLELRKTGTTLTILGLTDCYLDVVKCGFKDFTIQRRKTSSDSWEDYYEYGNLYIESTAANLETTLVVESGYQYRISCKHYAKKNILSVQTIANTSNIVTVS